MMTLKRLIILVCACTAIACADTHTEKTDRTSNINLPYQQVGLNDRQAAAHLLDRLAFGGRPGDVDRIVEFGIEKWVSKQLTADFSDKQLQKDLKQVYYLPLTTREIYYMHPRNGQVKQDASKAGAIPSNFESLPFKKQKELLDSYYKKNNLERRSKLIKTAQAHKLYLATASDNQLRELLVDFWFNHFSVSSYDGEVRPFVPTYERDAIRPFVLGYFEEMLEATAKHPAMIFYLDNYRSYAPDTVWTLAQIKSIEEMRSNNRPEAEIQKRIQKHKNARENNRRKGKKSKYRGINENYARELLELHTLGVDGGYTQRDIGEVARVLTGWSVFPAHQQEKRMEERMAHNQRRGFVREGDFLFRGDHHDANAKTVLGRKFPANRGLEEGEELLRFLALHPSTAKHLSTKLATRFIDDNPPQSLIDRMAESYLDSGGNISSIMRTLVESKEFWQYRRSKIKSPFELVASSLRALNVKLKNPRQVQQWIFRMGQNVYGYNAPSGYPDRAEAWINTGALLNRMKFGLSLAAGKIKGVRVDLPKLNNYHEPESAEAALMTYAELLLPERDLSETVDVMRSLIYDPLIDQKVADAIDLSGKASESDGLDDNNEPLNTSGGPAEVDLAQVVGVLLGSPEFQR
ncbi:MAG: DUF1800 domain-containing protein, partial [Calditrichota bacterium]